ATLRAAWGRLTAAPARDTQVDRRPTSNGPPRAQRRRSCPHGPPGESKTRRLALPGAVFRLAARKRTGGDEVDVGEVGMRRRARRGGTHGSRTMSRQDD